MCPAGHGGAALPNGSPVSSGTAIGSVQLTVSYRVTEQSGADGWSGMRCQHRSPPTRLSEDIDV